MPPPERPAIVRYGYAVLVVVVALGVAVALHSFDLEGFLFVIAVAVAVWIGGRGPGVVAVVLSVVVLHYVFIAPERTGSMLPLYGYFVVFSVLTALITALSEARHRAERSLLQARDDLERKVQDRTAEIRRQAELLRLAHDAVIVRDPDDRITFWNRGAEETYGWTAEEARGHVIHDLLHTTFPRRSSARPFFAPSGRRTGWSEGRRVPRRSSVSSGPRSRPACRSSASRPGEPP